jgi:uncharacterized protein (DUF2235 family)
MSRKIILLSDGTGNSSAKVWRTNVWRVFESLDLTDSNQLAFYDDGVGTAAFKPMAILGGAFGYGLKRNVIDLYMFACRNYRGAADEIYGFGFSRGAFTIRVVVGLILDQGLVQANSDAELYAQAKDAYRSFRAKHFHTKWPRRLRPEELARWLRNLFLRSKYTDAHNRKDVKIRFLGLWDTVAAYGMPVEEMSRGISQWIWPWMLPDCYLDPRVQRACHALSVDDERTTFHPVLWDERKEAPLLPDKAGKRYVANERISQVWYPGVHSNVGGGYPDDSVAQIPLIWMLSEATTCGLRFKSVPDANPQTYGHPNTAQDKDGRIYDPRKGLGGYYRYGPRDMTTLGKELLSRRGHEALPRVHESVLKRIQNRAHSYTPTGLPDRYEIVTADGEVLAPEQSSYEPAAQALARWHLQEKVWNTVWLRRIVYFLTVGVSVYLFAFPLMRAVPVDDEYKTQLRWASDIVRMIGGVLPSAAQPWIDGYARQPGQFILVALLLAVMLLWGSWLAGKIQSQMDILWQNSLGSRLVDEGSPTDLIYRLRTNQIYIWIHQTLKTSVAPAFFALLFAYLGVTFTSHALFNIQDDAGWVCRESAARLQTLSPGEIVLADGSTRKLSDLANEAKNDPSLSKEDKANPFKYVRNLPIFETSNLCQSMKVELERNRKYLIRFEDTTSFRDGTIDAPKGFYSTDPPSLWQKALMFSAIPLRRELIRPWFRVVARFGGTGGEENFLDPDAKPNPKDPSTLIDEEVAATRDGELFLFVNDAVIGIPGLYEAFYRNNKGSTKVLIEGR